MDRNLVTGILGGQPNFFRMNGILFFKTVKLTAADKK